MLKGTATACPNHPGIEATVRCKQCSRAVCQACAIQGPTGLFCSEACRDKHQLFYQRAQAMDGKARSSFFAKFRSLLTTVIVCAAVLGALGVVGSLFQIPILTPLTYYFRDIIGI
jgi:hypothetical protein